MLRVFGKHVYLGIMKTTYMAKNKCHKQIHQGDRETNKQVTSPQIEA